MTTDASRRRRVLVLLSGGLDSQLAVCLLREQPLDVEGVVFRSPFFDLTSAKKASAQLDIPLHVVDFTADIVDLIENPPHGFGSCMNPCIDCHARMLNRAGRLMEEVGADFLATGEVLDERPMSQNRRSLDVVARESGYEAYILRPLSAQLLPETVAERNGWINRDRLESLHGRGRKRQFQLAEQYGLQEFPSPAGGCRLTEPNFCRRLKDLKEHEGLHGVRSLQLLKVGRHFRLTDTLKLIVGRNEQDNAIIEGNAELYDLLLKTEDIPGPTGLLPMQASEEQVQVAARICARYSDAASGTNVSIRIRSARNSRRIQVQAAAPEFTEKHLV